MQSNLRISKPIIFLYAFLFITQILNGLHVARGAENSAIVNSRRLLWSVYSRSNYLSACKQITCKQLTIRLFKTPRMLLLFF